MYVRMSQSSRAMHAKVLNRRMVTGRAVNRVYSQKVGKIELITGPMFAGKTTELIRRIEEANARDHKVLVVKSDKDTRYSHNNIASHTGKFIPCLAVGSLGEILQNPHKKDFDAVSTIAIDEAQFFPDLYEFVTVAADIHCKVVYVSGLVGDFRRSRFGQMLDLVPHAESILKLNARCEVCQKDAFFTQRTVAAAGQELVGGAEAYRPVCREHYNQGISPSSVIAPNTEVTEAAH